MSKSIEADEESDIQVSDLSILLKDNSIQILDQGYENVTDQIEYIFEKFTPNTAFYIVNLGEVIKQIKLWRELFPNIEPRYAVKCNPNSVICQLLYIMKVGFDVASKNEINLVKDYDVDKIIYANPCKEMSSIKYARSVGINMLVIDSEHELYKIKLLHPRAKLIIRLKVDDSGSECRFSTKFGVDFEEARKIIELCKDMNLKIHGVSFHVGSSCKNPELYKDALEMCSKVFQMNKEITDYDLQLVDIGGGFPGDDENMLKKIADNVKEGIEEHFSGYENVEFISEPGRFFVKSSHTLMVNVIGKKMKKTDENTTFMYYLNDGIYGSFNCILFDHQNPVIIPYVTHELDEHVYSSTIFGPTCDSVDTICQSVLMPELEIGDWCYVKNFGAYTVASSSDFNGFTKLKVFYILSE